MNPILFVLLFISFENIIARGPPTLLPHTPNIITLNVNENEPMELHCPVVNSPDLSVQWSKNNEDLDLMWSTSNVVIRRFLLQIRHTTVEDAGLYKCSIVNGFGHAQVLFRVNVKSNETSPRPEPTAWDVDSLIGEAPKFLSRNAGNPTDITKVIQPEGTTAQLKCFASGKPTPQTRWKKNGKILSEDDYGITQGPILNIKDLRQSDTGNYTCEVFNSFGMINATYTLSVTEKLDFLGSDPQNSSVGLGKTAILNCRIRTDDPETKIQWLKKLDSQDLFRANAIVFDAEQYENIEQSQKQQYVLGILSKSLIFPQINTKESGQYICLIQNDKATNYRKASIRIIDSQTDASTDNKNILPYVIIIPLFILVLIFFLIFCLRRKTHQSHGISSLKSSAHPRQAAFHHEAMIPSTKSNDYLADSVDSLPVPRIYQHQRYGPSAASDLASLTSSHLYYAKAQAI